MEQDVYIDILFLINFSMDYLCLYICTKILHRPMRTVRMISAAAIGGIYSVVSIFLPISSAFELALDCFVCLLLCLIVYLESGRGIGSFIAASFLFIGISMMTGGCMTAIFNLLNKLNLPLDLVEGDGISVYLFAILALAGSIISLKSGQVISRKSSVSECRLFVRFCGEDFSFFGLSDSGNLVRDPICGKAVIFLDKHVIQQKISLGFLDDFVNGKLDASAPCKNLRLIALKTATGTSMAVAVQPESIRAEFEEKKGKKISIEIDALISPTDIGKASDGYTAIIPSDILKK